jgi:hypothetical protein
MQGTGALHTIIVSESYAEGILKKFISLPDGEERKGG